VKRRVWLVAGLVNAMALGCEREPAAVSTGRGSSLPATSLSSVVSADTQPTGDRARLGLPDLVMEPVVDAEEQAAPCPRVLSAAPNVTEICWSLGLGPCLVGRTRYCTYPPAVQNVRSIGALNDLNVEGLLDLRPELVIVSGTSRAIRDRLDRLGIPHTSVPDVSLEDLFTAIQRIGSATGRPATAQRLANAVRADLDRVACRYARRPARRVLVLTGPLADPPVQVDAAGPGSFYDDLLRRAGCENVAAAAGRPFTPLSLEFVLQADPDVIVELVPDAAARPGGDVDALRIWSRVGPLRAVRTGRVHVLVGEQYFILGPRVAHTLAALCELIHGAPDE